MWRNIIVTFNIILKAYSSAKTSKCRKGIKEMIDFILTTQQIFVIPNYLNLKT